MDLDPGERDYLLDMRALTTDLDGCEIFVGLTVTESDEYYALTRFDALDRKTGETPEPHSARHERYRALDERMEMARIATIMAEHQVKTDKPTRN